MSIFLIGVLAAVMTSNPPVSGSNVVAPALSTAASQPDAAVEKEYEKLVADDEDALASVDKWIKDNREFAAKGAGVPAAELNQRILERLTPVRKAYEDFIQRHPNHARARIAFASFLNDMHEERGAREQLEKALALDPKNPAIYNNLAELYADGGPTEKAFEFYSKAIELNPQEPLYYDNFATVVYLFRTNAMEFFGISKEQVMPKSIQLYSNAMRLDPNNFPLASRLAETYYSINPVPTDEALHAWTNALQIAHDEIEREGVYIHFARLKLHAGRVAEARIHLDAVTNEIYAGLKKSIASGADARQGKTNATPTNAPASFKR